MQEVIELLSSFRATMRKNFELFDVDKIQERWYVPNPSNTSAADLLPSTSPSFPLFLPPLTVISFLPLLLLFLPFRCCGDEPWLFRERWEKLFEDFCDVKPEKFDPSRVSELYDTIKYCALHHRAFLFAIFDEKSSKDHVQQQDRKLHELYGRAKALFDLVAPQEYGIDPDEKYVSVLFYPVTPSLCCWTLSECRLTGNFWFLCIKGGDRRADLATAPAERGRRSRECEE